MLKLIEDDYGVFRKYQGLSSMKTYLTVAINRLLLDYQNHLWTKWRTSMEAGRLGPIAEELEKLLVRDGFTFSEACQKLQMEGEELSEAELTEIRAKLPPRFIRRFVGEETLQAMASRELRPDERLEIKEKVAFGRRVMMAVHRAIQSLPAEDQLLVRMGTRFSVANIARMRQMEQKPLYRRMVKIYQELRKALEREGIRKQDIDDILRFLGPGFLDFLG